MKPCWSLSPSMIPMTRWPKVIIAAMLTDSMSVALGGTPTRPSSPRLPSAACPAAIAVSRPLVSSAKSTPSVAIARIAAATSPVAGSIASVAPRSIASARRAVIGSTTMIRAHPRILPAITAARPTGPAPKIASVLPAPQSSERITAPAPVWSPHASGPRVARSSPAGSILTTLRAGATAKLAKEDWPKKCDAIDCPSLASAVVPSGRAPA